MGDMVWLAPVNWVSWPRGVRVGGLKLGERKGQIVIFKY